MLGTTRNVESFVVCDSTTSIIMGPWDHGSPSLGSGSSFQPDGCECQGLRGSQRVSEGPRVVRTVCTDFQRKISISVINIDARLHTKGLPLVSDIIFEMILHLPGGSLDFNKGTTPCLLPPHPPPCAYPLLTYWEPSRQPHHSETATPTPSQALGYNTFGAGGFFGDSEKAPGQWIQCWSWLSLKVSIFWGKRWQRRYLVRWKLKVGEHRCHNSEMWMWPFQSTEHGDFAPFDPPN